ncbi:MAG TPA: response regulator [Gemmatimonadales bacterium]|nr:response regulator [Gemmatimonadales bacterium]
MSEGPRNSRPLRYDLAGTAGDGPASGPAGTVLVVDDDSDVTRFIGAVLASRGLATVAAYDPIQGFLVAQRQHPRLILVDWHMPAGGGPQLLRRLRDSPKTATIPVIVITSDSSPNLPDEARALGARLFVHKPLDPERLVEAVSKIVA